MRIERLPIWYGSFRYRHIRAKTLKLSWRAKIARPRGRPLSSRVTSYNYKNRGRERQSGGNCCKCNFFLDFIRTGVNNWQTLGVLWAEGDFPQNVSRRETAQSCNAIRRLR